MAAGDGLAGERAHADGVAQRLLVVRRRLVEVPHRLQRETHVGVSYELARDVGDREVLRVVLDRLGELAVGAVVAGGARRRAAELERHADAVARERLADGVGRLERRA